MAIDLLQIEAEAESLATLLGLNSWELQQAQYNGCSFSILLPVGTALTGSAIGQAVANGTYTYNKTLGKQSKNQDPNRYGKLLNTNLFIENARDNLKAKWIRKKIPYANYDSIEFMGYSGWSFKLYALFTGFDYLTGFNNFLNAINNPPSEAVTNVLIHPIYGQIAGKTILSDINAIYVPDRRQSISLELSFEAEESLAFKNAGHNAQAIAGASLTALLQTIGAVASAISLVQSVAK